jgi:hypothetical protein
MSVVTGDNLSVKNAYVAGFGAYQKKPQFGPATMELTNVKIEDTVTYAVSQTGSSIKINGNTIESQDFDIPLMYKLGIFGN